MGVVRSGHFWQLGSIASLVTETTGGKILVAFWPKHGLRSDLRMLNFTNFSPCKLIPILYGSFLCTTTYGSFLCTKFPILYGSFFMYKASYIYGSILCIAPPILHKMVPIYRVSYVLLWVHLMYTDYCRVLLLYIRWSLYI